MLYLIDNYDSFTYNLYQQVGVLSNEPIKVVKNDALSVTQLKALKPTALLLSPGSGNPDQAGHTLDYIDAFIGQLPIMGVCLGHQAIAQYYGGKVVHAKHLMHGKASKIECLGKSKLFANCPKHFQGARYHSLSVTDLPNSLTVTAKSEDNEIMGIEDAKYQVFGVQFHPESILTDAVVGNQIMKNFLKQVSAQVLTH